MGKLHNPRRCKAAADTTQFVTVLVDLCKPLLIVLVVGEEVVVAAL